MINFKTCATAVTLIALTACQSETTSTETAEGLANCPAEKTITDVAAYQEGLKDLPDAMLDYGTWHEANGNREGVQTTDSGVQYFVVQEGAEDGLSPVGSQVIKANYHGIFRNGETFDSSYERGQAMEHNANGFIRGWNEMLADMKVCEARTLYVPGNLAYGPSGRGEIPPNATLLFHMQLLAVKQ